MNLMNQVCVFTGGTKGIACHPQSRRESLGTRLCRLRTLLES